MKENRIEWLSVLQGWSMLLVVVGHVTLTNLFLNPETPFSAEIERIIYSFHMPLFMFISGFLFYHTKIRKEKGYCDTLKDKAKRLLIPYGFFTLCTFAVKYMFSSLMVNPVAFSFEELFNILTFSTNPLGEMWFITALFVIFIFYPLFRYSIKNTYTMVLLGTLLLLLNLYFPKDVHVFQISNAAFYMFYFYLGILSCKFEWNKFLDNQIVLLLSLVVFTALYHFQAELILLNLSGIACSVSLCLVVSRYIPSLFSSFREYTFQIFLMGIFFQMLCRYLYAKIGMEVLYWPLYMVSIMLAIYVPVLIARIISKSKYRIVRQAFGL